MTKITPIGLTEALEIFNSNVCGPLEKFSKRGVLYCVTCIELFSKWTTVYRIRVNPEVVMSFVEFMARVERQNRFKLEALHRDSGGKYLSIEFSNVQKDRETTSLQTRTYTPQKIGTDERMNRTFLQILRKLPNHKSVPKEFWPEASSAACNFRTRMTSREASSNCT